MLGLRYFTHRLEKQEKAGKDAEPAAVSSALPAAAPALPWGLLVAISIDSRKL